MIATNNINVQECAWKTHHKELAAIRETVFIKEQQVPVELEWDGEDENASHFIAYCNNKPAGTARLLHTGQIGRMSVLKPYRHLGIGKALLQKAEATAIRQGLTPFLHAQTYIKHFYASEGYRERGDEFMDAGIPHIEMFKEVG